MASRGETHARPRPAPAPGARLDQAEAQVAVGADLHAGRRRSLSLPRHHPSSDWRRGTPFAVDLHADAQTGPAIAIGGAAAARAASSLAMVTTITAEALSSCPS